MWWSQHRSDPESCAAKSDLPNLWTFNPIWSCKHFPRPHLMQILSLLLAVSFKKAQGWVLRVSNRAGEGFGEENKELYFKSILDWGKTRKKKARKTAPNLKNEGLLQENAVSSEGAEFCRKISLREMHINTAKLKLRQHCGVVIFLKSKCNKAICCPWGSAGSITMGRHAPKKFWALPGTFWSPQFPRKAGMVFWDLIRNLWHVAKLKPLALVWDKKRVQVRKMKWATKVF